MCVNTHFYKTVQYIHERTQVANTTQYTFFVYIHLYVSRVKVSVALAINRRVLLDSLRDRRAIPVVFLTFGTSCVTLGCVPRSLPALEKFVYSHRSTRDVNYRFAALTGEYRNATCTAHTDQ